MSEILAPHTMPPPAAAPSSIPPASPVLTRKDFTSDQMVRWCPGCGDYSILAQMQSIMPTLGIPRENIVFVSGIGCSSRFPYYMNTYGFHSIHGRAPAIATGLRMVRDDLQIWVMTGDGDALSIGGNHFIHAIRRNMDLKIVLFNNQIYGLTKGQYSPTSVVGQKTKSSPFGSLDYPIHPISLALAAEASFVARVMDADPKHMNQIFTAAAKHSGTAFIEVYQNCLIFNDGAFNHVSDKIQRPENALYLEEGKPLRFGENLSRGIRLQGTRPAIVEDAADGDLLVHDSKQEDPTYAYLLSRMHHPELPVPFGVFRDTTRPSYDSMVRDRMNEMKSRTKKTVQDVLAGNNTWDVK